MSKGRAIVVLLSLVLILSLLLGASCGPTPTPQVIKETVVVRQTQVVEKVVEKPVTQVVEKKVVETKVVEKPVTQIVERAITKLVEVTPTPKPVPEKAVLKLNLGTEPPTLDPALAEDNVSINVLEQLFLGLTDLEEGTNAVKPELATKWEASADGLVWTFTMRNDVRWVQLNPATGEVKDLGPVTAHDVVYAVRRSLDPETASPYSEVLKVIKGAEEFAAGKGKAEDVGVAAPMTYTVRFTLKGPAGYFPAIAGMWVARPMPKSVIADKGARWIEPGFIVTNGPYMLKEWAHSDHLVLVKNPKYYGAKEVQIEEIYGVMIQEASTAMAMYEAGELDYLGQPGGGPPLPDMDRIRADATLSKQLDIGPDLATYYYGFVNTKPPMDNPLVRKAFTAAIDRKAIVEKVTKGGQTPATSFTAPGNFGAAPAGKVGIPTNCEQAKKYLAEAGYPDGKGLPQIVLMHNVSEAHAKIAQAIQDMWKSCLGVSVKIETQEWKVYLDTLKPDAPDKDKPHIYRIGWGADYPDANNWLNDVYYSKSGSNYAKFKNEEFDKLVRQAQVESDPAKRQELYLKAEKILTEEVCAIAPIYHYTQVWMVKPYITKYAKAQAGGQHWDRWQIDIKAKQAAAKK